MREERLTYTFWLRNVFILLFTGFFIFLNVGFTTVSEDGKLSFFSEQTEEDVDGEELPSFELEDELIMENNIHFSVDFQEDKHAMEEIALLLPISISYLPSTPPPEHAI